MTPFYTADYGSLYHGNLKDVIPHIEPVDLCLTSPPYYTPDRVFEGQVMGAEKTVDDYVSPLSGLLLSLRAVYTGRMYLILGGEVPEAPLRVVLALCDGGMHMHLPGFWAHESGINYIFTFDGDPKRMVYTKRQVFHPGILSAKHEKFAGTHYPSFPPKLIKGILSHEPGSVIDPFCGAGTTCVVAESMRRRWIGIDVDEEALKRCVRRLKKA
jgi:DNA modification methylase